MHIKIALTEHIINQSLALYYIYNPLARKRQQKLLWIPLILLIISAYLIYVELQKSAETQTFYLPVLYIAFAFAYYFYMHKRMMNSGKQTLKTLGPDAFFEMDITEEKVTTITNTATITNDWSVFNFAIISNENVLIYQADSSFVMFNKGFFQTNDFALFKSWVKEKITPFVEV